MAGKQIDFPEIQKEDHRVAPVMIGLSLVFALIVVVLLLADVDGPFIGPWG
jgi:UDP-N-acetylmuramyl pentapeptide phosphotransferase/UDP-N-acetylglucosamine-1-phosphate transferase